MSKCYVQTDPIPTLNGDIKEVLFKALGVT